MFNAGQSFLFLILSFVPSIIEKKLKYDVPNFMEIIYLLFCLANNILGEIGQLYATVSWWDDMLHTISGVLIGILGFSLINILNKNAKNFSASPFFTAVFAVCLAVTVGVLWEIIEFSVDYISSGNMQRYRDSLTNEPLIGQAALYDTMSDLVEALIGSMFIATIGYIDMIKNKNRLKKLSITKIDENYNLNNGEKKEDER